MSHSFRRYVPLISTPLVLLCSLPLGAKVIWLQVGQEKSLEYNINVPSMERKGDELIMISQVRSGGTEQSFPTRIDCAHRKVTNQVPKGSPIPQTADADSRIGRNYLQLCYFD